MGGRNVLVVRATPRTGSNLVMCSLQQHPDVVSAGEIYVTSKKEFWEQGLKDRWNLCKTCYLDPLPIENAKTVFLYREDKEAQLKSYLKACESGEWLKGMQPLNPIEPIPNFLELVEKTFQVIAPQCDLVISYEDLVLNWNSKIFSILEFWELNICAINKAISKQTPATKFP